MDQTGALEKNVATVGEAEKDGIAFYVDAGSKTLKTWAQVQWLGENGAVLSNTVYHMDLSGVTLAMDEDSAPVIRPAKLHDNAETNAYKDEDLYTAGSYKAAITSQGAGGVYNVAITAQQLREHTNNGTPKTKGYWVGFELTAPETATQFKYASGATIPDDAEVKPVETLADGRSKGVAFYFNAQNKATRTITVQWVAEGDDATTCKPITFSVDLSGVAYYQAPSHGGSGSSGGSASTTYTLTFETNGGSAISKVTKNKGTTIDLAQYAPTKSGATFEGWYADKGLTKKITSVKLDANTTVYAKWTEAPVSGLPFGDVKSADWFYNDVKYVYEKGMMAGTAADVFAPNATTTRAMIVTILYRLEGSPAVTGTSAFVDVPAGQWYTDAVNWAAANQIVKGTSATTFAPNDSITREQMAAIL
ncbi:MAG: S-layer homology domain-containing protein [Evtepia sp.]